MRKTEAQRRGGDVSKAQWLGGPRGAKSLDVSQPLLWGSPQGPPLGLCDDKGHPRSVPAHSRCSVNEQPVSPLTKEPGWGARWVGGLSNAPSPSQERETRAPFTEQQRWLPPEPPCSVLLQFGGHCCPFGPKAADAPSPPPPTCWWGQHGTRASDQPSRPPGGCGGGEGDRAGRQGDTLSWGPGGCWVGAAPRTAGAPG